MRKCVAVLEIIVLMIVSAARLPASAETQARELTILFSSDIHSYFETYSSQIEGSVREHGGAGRLKTLVEENSNDHSIYVDAGDFAMGTLLQAGYASDAYELRLLGSVGCDATTFGNHEFDFGGDGAARMLRSAIASGDPLPQLIIPANLTYSENMTEEQESLRDALEAINAQSFMIREINGIRVAIFALMGKEAASYTPTSGVIWENPVKAAKAVVAEIGDQADVIICLSHSGTNSDGKTGEDIELIKKVPQVDVVISGHSHTTYHQVVTRNGALLGSCGAYLSYLGKLDITVDAHGNVQCSDYTLIPCDENVDSDAALDEKVADFHEEINSNYLSAYGYAYDTVIAYSDFSFMTLDEMYASWEEYPLAELIADAYRYAYAENGQDDVDIAMVGLGTIRGSISEGDITAANAFEICSLGVGSDGSAGHPIIACYLSGAELKALAELEALAGDLEPGFRMSYSGLNYTCYKNRAPFDRVKDFCIEAEDGTLTPVESGRLYKVSVNMYAANLLNQLRKRSYGIVNIVPKNADGSEADLSNLYSYALTDANGREVKEWQALCDYLSSFGQVNGVSVIPERYSEPLRRTRFVNAKGFELIASPGISTVILMALGIALIALITVLVLTRKKRRAARLRKRAVRRMKKQNTN